MKLAKGARTVFHDFDQDARVDENGGQTSK